MPFGNLFAPIRIGKTTIRNRVAMAPMVTQYADRGYVSEQQLAYYAARARGGVGLIITEAMLASESAEPVCPLSLTRLYDHTHMLGLAELTDAVHAFGAKIFVQLNIGLGAQGLPLRPGVQSMSASAVAYTLTPEMAPRNVLGAFAAHASGVLPREMTGEEIEREQDAFVRSAMMARQVGFDGLEIHAAHGFLLHCFLSPRFNRRTDRYGGSLENRMRFLVELVRRTKDAVGDDMTIGVRASVGEHVPGGTTYEDACLIVERLAAEGIDYLHVGDGTFESLRYTIPDEPDTMLPAAAGLKKVTTMPIVTPSIHDPHTAERALASGLTDMISLGRQLVADPDWPNKVRRGRLADIRKCDRCNRGCFARIFQGLRVQCVRNPESGLERYNPQYTRWVARQKAIEKRMGRAPA